MTNASQALIRDLQIARAELFATLDTIDPAALEAPGLVGNWTARELVAHLGYWTGHAVDLIHAVESGRAAEAGIGQRSVDEINETVARVARQTDLASVRKREAASAQALAERLIEIDPAVLAERLPDGTTLAEDIDEDGPAHYREHLAALRSRRVDR
ncbi:MAG: maleylpyruvate isomerase N-terminal domain-containing protein [Chloroflexota bacterium]|nr:maleylpyruvate isomerase N-terminal domain-containing protein [Chloroflexota bacterium]